MNNRFSLIRLALSSNGGRCITESDYGFGYFGDPTQQKEYAWARRFYTFKCVLCLLFCPRRKSKEQYFTQWVVVVQAAFDNEPLIFSSGSVSWDEVSVGYGLFCNWYVMEYWNGYDSGHEF